MHKGHFASGRIEGTGAALTVELGFVPEWVRVVNQDGLCTLEWFSGMDDASGIKAVTAGTISEITTNGITPYDGSVADEGAGFTIGADTDVNVDGEFLQYVAVSSDA